jgi:peroxidase
LCSWTTRRQLRFNGAPILGSDQALYDDERSRGSVELYAVDEDAFFEDFAGAMTRLGRIGVRMAGSGEMRRAFRFPN